MPSDNIGYYAGDAVNVLDTSNGRTLTAWVRRVDASGVQVYVERFKNLMTFVNGKTRLGRFELAGHQ